MKYYFRIGIVLVVTILSSCSHYSNTKKDEKSFSMSYGESPKVVKMKRNPNADRQGIRGFKKMGFDPASFALDIVVGYIFDVVNDEVAERRNGDSDAVGVNLGDTSSFPHNGFLLVMRVVKDPKNEFSNIASVKDFMEGKANSIGGALLAASANDIAVKPSSIVAAAKRTLKGKKYSATDKIGLFVLCPIQKLKGAKGVYAITLGGMYYPLAGGSRFGFEQPDIARRVSKAKEALSLEVYGPNGSGYSTGVVDVPLVWSPPSSKDTSAKWISAKELKDALIDGDQSKQLDVLLSANLAARLATRSAFIRAKSDVAHLLRGNAFLRESSKVSGWLKKGIDSLEDEVSE